MCNITLDPYHKERCSKTWHVLERMTANARCVHVSYLPTQEICTSSQTSVLDPELHGTIPVKVESMNVPRLSSAPLYATLSEPTT